MTVQFSGDPTSFQLDNGIQFLWDLIQHNFIIMSKMCKKKKKTLHVHICLKPQGGGKDPSVTETDFVIFKQMTYFLSRSKLAYCSAYLVPGGSYTSTPS